jgi:hypothetical protein
VKEPKTAKEKVVASPDKAVLPDQIVSEKTVKDIIELDDANSESEDDDQKKRELNS